MFLGYQNNKIAFIANTREELENLPCVTLDKIEETDKEYTLYKGEYVSEISIEQLKEDVRQVREQLYKEKVDPITSHINRLKDEEQTEEVIAEIDLLKQERAEIIAKIKEENPYPEE